MCNKRILSTFVLTLLCIVLWSGPLAFGQGHEFQDTESPSRFVISGVQESAEDEVMATGGGSECRSCTVQDINLMFCSQTEHCCGSTVEIFVEISGTMAEPGTLIVALWEDDVFFDDLICDHELILEAGPFNIQVSCTVDLCEFRFGNIELYARVDIVDCTMDCFCRTSFIAVFANSNPCCGVECPGPTGPCDGGQECDPFAAGCVDLPDTPASTLCDTDMDVCTIEQCDGLGTCDLVENLDCDDGNDCTDDLCDATEGCQNPIGAGLDCATDSDCLEDEICFDCACIPLNRTLIIKQGACPAPVNPNSNGVLPMVLVSAAGFDASSAVSGSLALRRCDGEASVAPLANHTQIKDLNHPADVAECGGCACNANQSSDGLDDLSLKFSVNEMVTAGIIGAGDGQVTLELSGELADGTPFVARDCILVPQPGQVSPANVAFGSTVTDTYLEVWPYDLNFDIDGFTNFGRAYYSGTVLTLTAPARSDGRRFVRWGVNGVMQDFGVRTVEVLVEEDINLRAIYERQSRVRPDRPTEDDGDLE